METTTCHHKHCGQPIGKYVLPVYKWSEAHGARVPFHTACSYAHPDYDVSKREGSPFTTINLRVV